VFAQLPGVVEIDLRAGLTSWTIGCAQSVGMAVVCTGGPSSTGVQTSTRYRVDVPLPLVFCNGYHCDDENGGSDKESDKEATEIQMSSDAGGTTEPPQPPTTGRTQTPQNVLEGSGGAAEAEAAASEALDAATEAQRAVESAKADPNKVSHIFDQVKHNWDMTGQDQQGNWNLIENTLQNKYGQLPSNGFYEVTQNFEDYTVTVRGAVVNGAVRIGSAWVNAI